MKKKWIGVLAAAAVTAALGILGCGSGNGAGSAAASSSAVNASGKKIVRVAHTNYYVPYDFVNDKGESDGIEVAILKEVAKKLPQYEFQYYPTSDDDLLIGVESGKYDVGTKGIWKTPAREKKYIFPKQYISASVIGITFRKEDQDKIKDLDSFAQQHLKLVPIAPQNAQYAVIEDFNAKHPDTPIALEASETFKLADAYSWVLEGRYDAYFDVELSYKNNVASDKGTYHQFNDKLAYVRYKALPTWPLFNRKDQQLADDYDKAIQELIAEGKIKELEQKYFGEELTRLVK